MLNNLFKKHQYLPSDRNTKIILLPGLIVSCLLITIIGAISWLTIENINEQIKNLINETNLKTSLIYDMRIAARERNLHLSMTLLVDDPFLADDEWMKFRSQGSLFLKAREDYKKHKLNEIEKELLNKQREISKHAVKLQYEINNFRMSGDLENATRTLHEEITAQVKVFSILDELLDFQNNTNQISIENIYKSHNKTQKEIIILIIFLLSIMYLTATHLGQQLNKQAQKIENELIRFKALIEGSMDAVLVLDKNAVTDCNKNALNLFAVESLEELNHIGLDYFSHFSDQKESLESNNIFNAVNHAMVSDKKRYEWQFKNIEGIAIPTDVELQGVRLDNKDYVQMVIRDITDRKKAQQDLHEANENLEKKVLKRTKELKQVNTKIIGLARSAGMSEVASGVLHNVGNVLNSVNVSSSVLKSRTINSKPYNLDKIAMKFHEHKGNIDEYLENDEAGKLVVPYIEKLSQRLSEEKKVQLLEIDDLIKNVEHIKNIISMQQTYAGNVGVIEKVHASEVADDAIKINITSINNNNINLSKYYNFDIEMSVDKHKLLQILVNLISNAKHAVINGGKTEKNIILGIQKFNNDIKFYVEDNGVGIDKVDIERIFEFGFKKRADGHGYGLHHSAIVAKELGGTLTVESDGLKEGAKFILIIPTKQP